MKKLAVHTNRKLTPNLKHNDRSTKEKHKNVFEEKSELNQIDKSALEAMREIRKLYAQAMEKQKGKKGKKTPIEHSYIEMIFEIDEKHTLKDCQKLADEICKLTGFRKIQIALHKDEGHYENEEDEASFKTHNHAHAVFFTLSEEDGKQLARKEKSLSDTNLSKLQDLAYKVLRGGVREKGEKKEYLSDYRDHKRLKERESELNNRENELNNRENELNQREDSLNTKESEIQGKELKEQEYNHYQELLELQKDDSSYFAIPLGYDLLKNVEELGSDIYTPLRNIYAMEYINYLSLKTGLSMVFDGFADDKNSPIVLVKYGKNQRKLTREEFISKLKENLPSNKDISNFKTFQDLYHLTTILRDNHKTLQDMGFTKSYTPVKVNVPQDIRTTIRKALRSIGYGLSK